MKTKNEKANKWFSTDNRVLWRLPKDIFSSPMKLVSIKDVDRNTRKALELISRIAGERSDNLPELSPAALRDFDVVSILLEINDSTSLGTQKQTAEAFDYLSKEEQEIGVELAKAVLEAVNDDLRAGSNNQTLPALKDAIEDFQLWLELLTDASARIKLGIKRDAA